MFYCENCGAELRTGALFCKNCGHRLPQEPAGTQGSLMGNQNVISGDVSSTINNTTTHIHQNDSHTTVSCAVCGKLLSKGSGQMYLCGQCGNYVCADHIDPAQHKCLSCMEQDHQLRQQAQTEHDLAPFRYQQLSNGKYVITQLLDIFALDVTVPVCVESIAAEAFAGSRVLRVSLPDGLLAIDDGAFRDCRMLKQINIPASVLYIGDEAFCNCEKLNITLPDTADLGQNVLSGTMTEKIEKQRKEEALAALQLRLQEEAQRKAREAEARRKEEEDARIRAEAERRRREEEARAKAEAERRRLEEEARAAAEAAQRRMEAARMEKERIDRLRARREEIRPAQHLIAAGEEHSVGVRISGTVASTIITDNCPVVSMRTTKRFGPWKVASWSDITAVFAGPVYTIGLKSDGTLVTADCQDGFDKCVIPGIASWRNIVDVAISLFHIVGLKSDGTVVAARLANGPYTDYGQCNVSGWKNIVAISASNTHTVGLRADGTVVATRFTEDPCLYHGQCEVSGWKDIVAVSASENLTVGLRADGTVVTTEITAKWMISASDYNKEAVADWKDIVAISAGNHCTLGLKADGTVVVTKFRWKDQFGREALFDVSGWQNVVAICAGPWHVMGLTADGRVLTDGGSHGQNDAEKWKLCDHPLAIEQERQAFRQAQEEARRRAEEEKRRAAEEAARKKAQEERDAKIRRCKELLTEEQSLLRERAVLTGFFSGRRRKAIDARLESIRAQLGRFDDSIRNSANG